MRGIRGASRCCVPCERRIRARPPSRPPTPNGSISDPTARTGARTCSRAELLMERFARTSPPGGRRYDEAVTQNGNGELASVDAVRGFESALAKQSHPTADGTLRLEPVEGVVHRAVRPVSHHH